MRQGQKALQKLCSKCSKSVSLSNFAKHTKACSVDFKVCTGPCGMRRPIEDFYKVRHDSPWRQSRCKECFRLQVRDWELTHPEHKKVDQDYAKRIRLQNPEKFRLKDLKNDLRKKGITLAQFEAMLLAQNYVCAICGQGNPKRRLAVDHNHTTEQNRGLLCDRCNTALERLETVPEWGILAQQYLEKYPSIQS